MSERTDRGDEPRDPVGGRLRAAHRETNQTTGGRGDEAPGFGAGVAAPGGGAAKSGAGDDEKPARRKKAAKKKATRRRTKAAEAGDANGGDSASREAASREGEASGGAAPRKRASSRSSAKRSEADDGDSVARAARDAEAPAKDATASEARPARKRRRTKKKTTASAEGEGDSRSSAEAASGGGGTSAAEREAAAPRLADGEASEAGEAKKRKRSRRRRASAKGTVSDQEASDEGASEAPARDDDSFGALPDGEEGGARAQRLRSKSPRSAASGIDRDDDRDRDDRDRDDRDRDDDRDRETTGSDEAGDGDAPKRRRKRGSRGGRRRKRAGGEGDGAGVDAIPGETDDLPAGAEARGDDGERAEGDKPKKKRRRSRKKSTATDERAEDGDEASEDDAEKPARKKTRRGGRGRKSAKAGDDDGERPEEGSKKKKRSRRKKARSAESDDLEPVEEEVVRDRTILVNADDQEEKRVAVIEDTKIVDFAMNAESQKSLVNDIYRGRVVNLEPAIGAAFVDFGQGRNGFLHTSDVLDVYGEDGFKLEHLLTTSIDMDDWEGSSNQSTLEETDDDEDDDEGAKGKKGGKKGEKKGDKNARRRSRKRQPITELVKLGDPVVVQVTKDAIGDKGPTLTTYISIPGRYLVLMPSMARNGVSRKIPDVKERKRLKRILASLKAPQGMGVIVRTAGVGKTKTALQRDLDYLLGVWDTFGQRLRQGRGPVPLYQESDIAIRTLRDLFDARTKEVVVDDPMVYDQLVEFAHQLMPEQEGRIRTHSGDRPIFHHFGVEQDFEKIFARRVDLPSGGSIVFDQTEALVAIDVNSGRTRTDGFDFEEIALKTNLEAVPEIARQIRLRDLGGIIVCDFIDMMRSSNMRAVERALRTELADDRARSKMGRISQFGLLEMTRQRLGPGTHKKVFQTCPRCRGTGRIRSVPSRAAAILRRLGSALTQKGFSKVEVRAHPEVVEYLQDDLSDYVRALEHRFDRQLELTGVPDQPEDSVLRYLRADGREVRPGGRRKR